MSARAQTLIVLLTLGIAPTSTASAELILNEALANEPGSVTSLEWVEILNWPDTGQPISLSGYRYVDGGDTTIISTSVAVPAGGYAMLARKTTGSASFEETWGDSSGVWGDDAAESYPLIAVSKMSLRNSSDTIRLVSPAGHVSLILWQSDVGDGISTERIRPGSDDALSNFARCKDSTGSTPGRANSVLPPRGDLAIDTVVVGPADPEYGDTIRFAVGIRNVGYGEAPPGSINLFRDADPSASNGPLEPVASVSYDAVLESGDTAIVLEWSDAPPGISHLVLILSSDADKSNNTASVSVILRFNRPLLIISEFLANPEPGGPEEWVEFVNLAPRSVSLNGMQLGDSLNTESIPTPVMDIYPYEFWVLTESESAFRAYYPAFDGTVIAVPGWRALNNTGDRIRLIGPIGEIIDSVSFRATYPGNRSMERVELVPAFGSLGDWAGSNDRLAATPGLPNSVVRGEPGFLSIDSAWIAPESPKWGDTMVISTAVTNRGFGPVSGWKLRMQRDLDLSNPGAHLEIIGDSDIEWMAEGGSAIVNISWDYPPPGIHRISSTLLDESGGAADTTALLLTVRFSRPLLIISEYMAAPDLNGPGEWIEIYNASQPQLSLNGLKIGDSTSLSLLPPPVVSLDSGQFLVLAQDEAQFRSHFASFDADVIEVPGWRTLNDTGDRIRLVGPSGEIIDSVTFGPGYEGNRSIERRQLVPEFADPRDWGECVDLQEATPGAMNSIHRFLFDLAIDSVWGTEAHTVPEFDYDISVRVKNVGFASAPPSEAVTNHLTQLLGTHGHAIPALSVGETFELVDRWADLPPGINRIVISMPPDENPTNDAVIFSIPVRFAKPDIIVAEFLANPSVGGPGEWIEVLNLSHYTFDATELYVGDASSLVPWITVPTPPNPGASLSIRPGEYWVLAQDGQAFRAHFPDYSGVVWQVRGWKALNNEGDLIRLAGASQEVIDSFSISVVYDENHSAERLDISPSFSSSSDWTMSVDPSGSTPGRPNSVNAAAAGPLQVDVSPNPVYRSSGQIARIDYRLDIGERLTLKVFDRAGRLVRTLADDLPSATGYVEWNGADDSGSALRPGPYVLLARSEPTGSIKKMVVVIAP